MKINEYLETVSKRFKSGISGEHSYRSDLESLIRELANGIEVTNEPSKVTDCGNPDFVITQENIPVGFIEAKDLGKDLNSKQYEEQFARYKKALDNLIITDYLRFQFFEHGELETELQIAEIVGDSIKPLPENFEEFQTRIQNFCLFIGQTIKSSKKLAKMMASKARLLQVILEKAITSDEKSLANSSLQAQYTSFKDILIHDLTPSQFSDIYAQTLAYGMFSARYHDKNLAQFSRQEAAILIPKSNPFLRKLFQYVAGYDIDDRIKHTVDNLANVFLATNIQLLFQVADDKAQQDPIIHFYETFLAEYDPKLRKSRGVWYTPQPVVSFIVRAVDEILKTEFGLEDGLADTSKTKIKVEVQEQDGRTKTGYAMQEKEVHKVQILDPATGTGTFLAEVVQHIYSNHFESMDGIWGGYVEKDLIPRLHGFELLMASYAMAHLKMDMLLSETGYVAKNDQRFNIYLTNSLEEHHPETGTLFASWISDEANAANRIKRDSPVMVVLGNPPYSVSSSNKSDWIKELTKEYKKNLNERNIQPLSDDYIKFIRYAQHFIEKKGEGIIAMITNNSFLDGLIHRQMRKHLLETFDKIYIYDLHGNSKRKETAPDGSKDENVFDIMQGVSINIFVKSTIKRKKLAEVYHFDSFGKRQIKYELLNKHKFDSVKWKKLDIRSPNYFFVPKDFSSEIQYKKGFQITELFKVYGMGITSGNDKQLISFSLQILKVRYQKHEFIKKVHYRLFDERYIYYDTSLLERSRESLMGHLSKNFYNLGLISLRGVRNNSTSKFGITNNIIDKSVISTLDNGYVFPIYNYTKQTSEQEIIPERYPNLDSLIVKHLANNISLTFNDEKEDSEDSFAPIDILDYIYAILHSPSYREKYKEFLKIDFPRIPYPKDQETFWKLVKLGVELRQLHLMESVKMDKDMAQYPHTGDNIITRKLTKKDWVITDSDNQFGRIWINDNQCFENIPVIAWEFYIGGYQPAQKWLKDRRKRTLNVEDVKHYRKIIVVLTETDRLMKEIDKIEFE